MAWGPRPGPEGSGVAGEGRGRAVVAPHGLGETSDPGLHFLSLGFLICEMQTMGLLSPSHLARPPSTHP